ncbi:glycine--tRNA ligase subunit beta [Cereibacter azotoformans]|uniref:Glycine--tRNA ligase beta subunit n=1 Tax=Cereibacter azotoformans TaxID=43057 RepID=A0A2T5K711_9RHOB|nr:glycine--tRNA ligase subunit beta [Cereibacter azotoformans]MBO4169465.1 glycine--tRNA ligase subunit beta [Cereibacter azotoformans]PTR18142.1 glycyl-tRNA synthetase beta chain [Cereibacter azotoformans]UIJ31151.1 glycine--tRNA ligase subunit beta [Cereibacter azotoformans]
MPDLLIELFSEEIPARMQARAREDLKKLVTDGLVEAGLTYASAGAFSTPRRLVLSVEGLSAESPTLREERKGPKADAPAAAIEGFLRSTGLTRDQLETREDKKGAVLFAVVEKPGRRAPDIVAEVLERTIRAFPWPKSMRWGTGSLRWVRPLHSILCLLSDEAGSQVVPVTVDQVTAVNTTEGHRFMAPGRFAVTGFDDYRAKLQRAFVMLDAAEREQAIWHEATTQAFAQGLEVVPDAGLLAEVAGLVEWPVVLMGPIGEEFLGLPPEVLQTSMREHQKFFSVRNPATGRIEKFVTVANRETADHGATILKGNAKVLSARLSDARFFWENDRRTVQTVGLEGMAAGLAHVTFHNKLGSEADRIARIEALAREIAPLVGASPDLAAEAARVAKADLQSAMVGEFPELQGTMGSYYARAAGLPEPVALACKAHYQPLGPSDAVPTDPVSVAVALADKIDTLTGFWAIDEKPTGSKDPFALRRAALGVIRLVLATHRQLPLLSLFRLIFLWRQQLSVAGHADAYAVLVGVQVAIRRDGATVTTPSEAADLLTFFHDRLKVHLREQGIRHDVIDACLAMPGNDDLTLLVKRAEALSAFLKTDDGTNLLQGFKRANNILAQAEARDGVEYSFGADPKFAETDAERALFAALEQAEAAIAPAMQAEDFGAAMAAMAALRAPIDAFFDTVQVNADNPVLRRNRLNMLHSIRATCASVADLTRIEG